MSFDLYENVGKRDSWECEYTNWEKPKSPGKISDQEPQGSGDDASTSRHSRLPAVCVTLVCVLLLSALIVLGVKLNNMTREKNQLQIRYDNLTAERDQLHMERDEFQTRLNNSIQQCFRHFITTEKKSWNAARQDCRSKGADLVTVSSRKEQKFISKLVNGTEAWIGLTDAAEEGTWMWVDGSTLSTGYWWDNEPNNYNNDEHCAVTGSKFAKSELNTWADYPCNIPVLAICQMNTK